MTSERFPYITSLMPLHPLFISLATQTNWPVIELDTRAFPDEESYLRINNADILLSNPRPTKAVFIFHDLAKPNQNILSLLFLGELLKYHGATHLYLISPYLAYMRQDKVFHLGEGITAQYFANLLKHYFNGLITLDPHLHRIPKLQQLYPDNFVTKVISSQKVLADWLIENYPDSLLIGPDSESEQWVQAIANQSKQPYIIFNKIRTGDEQVSVSLEATQQKILTTQKKQPVLLDDIISSAHTMIQAVKYIHTIYPAQPAICVGIHALMNPGGYDALFKAGAKNIFTTNTVPHESNHIDVSDLLVREVMDYYKAL